MSLSEERLREIRERANLQCGLDGDDADDLLIYVDHLAAEVDRLRGGIEALCFRWRRSTNPALHMERDLRALLNPPTEGDDHE